MCEHLNSSYRRCLIAVQNYWFRFSLNNPNEIRILFRWRDIRVWCNVRSGAIARRSAFSNRARIHNASSIRSVSRWRWRCWLQSIQKEQPKSVLLHACLKLERFNLNFFYLYIKKKWFIDQTLHGILNENLKTVDCSNKLIVKKQIN